MKRSKKYIRIILIAFMVLLVALLLFTQTSFFKSKVKQALITAIEKELNVKLTIEKLKGNFYSNLTFNNIQFNQNDSLVAQIHKLHIEYNLWKLREGIVSIDTFIIDNPSFNIWQINDSTWNINSLINTNSKKPPKQNKPFDYEIHANYISVKDGSLRIRSLAEMEAHKTSNINLLVNGTYSQNETNIRLKHFKFSSQNPLFVLKNMSGNYKMNDSGIQVDSLLFVSEASDLNVDGNLVSKENNNTTITASRIDKNELAIFIPGFKLLCSPALNASFVTQNDSVLAWAELQHNNEQLRANISVNTLSKLLSKKDAVPYFATVEFNNFNLENWIEVNEQPALINGEIKINGANLLQPELNAAVWADLKNSRYNEVTFDTLLIDGIYHNDSLEAKLNVHTAYGKARVNGTLTDISTTARYNARINSESFNLSAFVPQLPGTTINGKISAIGSGFSIKNLQTNADLSLNKSSVYNLPLDSLQASVNINESVLTIDSLQLKVPGARASGSGVLSLDSLVLESLVHANIKSTKVIDSLVVLPIQFDSVTTATTISGPVNELKIGGDVDIFNAAGYGMETTSADAEYLVSLYKDSLLVHVNTTARNVETGPVCWDSTLVDFNYHNTGMSIEANVIWGDTINANLVTHITTGDTTTIEIPKFEANTMLSSYFIPDTVWASIYGMQKLEIENLTIKDYNNEEFLLAANGLISTLDSNSFDINIKSFDLQQLNSIISLPDSINGLLGSDIDISGLAQNPSVAGFIKIDNPKYNKYTLSTLLSNFNYSNQTGFAELTTEDLNSSFYTSINAPFNAYIDSLKFIYSVPDTFSANFIFDSLLVAPLSNKLFYTDSLSGKIDGTVTANGNFDNPQFFGELDFTDGHFADKTLGIDYNNIYTSLVFNENKMTMDTVLIHQKDGLLSLTGYIEFDSTLIKGNVKSSSLQLDANNFFVTRHRNYELLIDANSFVETNDEHPEFGGNIKVIRSDFYLPALIPDSKTDIENNVPLLLQALQESQDSVVINDDLTELNKNLEKNENPLYETLTGRLNVEIPRNTWIRNDDMRLELSGELEIVKTGSFFEIFGNIEVIRGQYILYGKRLNVQESQIVFQGGQELDPTLNLSAEYIYRGRDKEKRNLEVIITGKVSDPKISFLLDDAEISETDGISVLVFGATSDEIGYGGQNGMIGSMGSSAVASVITSQLSRTIGTQLKLDMIEVTSTENWQSAAFVVGKYITNDIFVTYQRGFGEVEDHEITPENVTVEYEINDKLFLRLESGSSKTSGIDLILKFEQEKEKIVPTAKPGQEIEN